MYINPYVNGVIRNLIYFIMGFGNTLKLEYVLVCKQWLTSIIYMVGKYKMEKTFLYMYKRNYNKVGKVLLADVLVSFFNMDTENNIWILKGVISICGDDEFVRSFKEKAVRWLIKKGIDMNITRSLELLMCNSDLCDKSEDKESNSIYNTISRLFKEGNQGQ